MKKAIQIDEKDNVATVTSDIEAGEIVEVLSPDGKDIGRPKLLDPIQFGHKLAIVDFEKGDRVI